jgi:hypothetical protein
MREAANGISNRQRGWSGAEIIIGTGLIFAFIFGLVWVVIPFDRYRDSRNARRSVECYSMLHAILMMESDKGTQYWGESEAPVDRDSGTAQIIVRNLDDVTCSPRRLTTPTCPGAERVGLKLPQAEWGCVTMLDDARYNDVGLVNRYLKSLPLDPSGPGMSEVQYIQGMPIGNGNTGYYINRSEGGRVEIGACHPEMGEIIRETR